MTGFTWVDFLVLGLVVALIASMFLRFPLPKDPTPRAKRPKAKDVFGRLRFDDLKMPTAKLPEDAAATPQEGTPSATRKTATWDPDRLKLGMGLEGAAKIAAIDPGFDEKTVLANAKAQVQAYYKAWNAKDETTLSTLCAPTWVAKATRTWGTAHTPFPLESVVAAAITTARTAGRTAVITVEVQLRLKNDKSTPSKPLTQQWVFARPFNSEDPTWEIQSITTGTDA